MCATCGCRKKTKKPKEKKNNKIYYRIKFWYNEGLVAFKRSFFIFADLEGRTRWKKGSRFFLLLIVNAIRKILADALRVGKIAKENF